MDVLEPNGNGGDKGPDLARSAVFLQWDAAEQRCTLSFDNQQCKNWEFILMLLENAKLQAQTSRQVAQAMQLQQAAQEQRQGEAQAQALLRQLRQQPHRR